MSKVVLKRIARSADPPGQVYGRAELDPDYLPDEARQAVLKQARMARAIEWVVAEPNPTTLGLAEHLKVSRATAWRMLAHPAFVAMLRKALSGRMSVSVQKAMSVIEHTIDQGSPLLRLRASMWLLERHDKLSKVAGLDAEDRDSDAVATVRAQAVIGKLQLLRAINDLCRRIPALAQHQEQLMSAVKGAVHVDVQKEGGDAWLDGELAEQEGEG